MTRRHSFTELSPLNAGLLAVLLIILAFSLYSIYNISSALTPVEQPPLPKISLTLITVPDCKQCLDITQVETFVKQHKANLTETITLSADESKELITTYNIKRAPAAIITGETENLTLQNFEKRNNALVFDTTPAPYLDIASGKIKGLVTVTHLTDTSCKECTSMTDVLEQLKQLGVTVQTVNTHDFKTSQAQQIIKTYNITKLPTLIFSNDAIAYEVFEQAWKEVGSTQKDGTLVLRKVPPPYRELPSKKIKGLITMTTITDSSCEKCLNTSIYKLIYTQNLGLSISKEKTIDATTPEGKTLIAKYNITKIPTTILSPEAEAYDTINKAWDQAGNRANDGSYVFRNVELLKQPYKDLTTGKIIVPEEE